MIHGNISARDGVIGVYAYTLTGHMRKKLRASVEQTVTELRVITKQEQHMMTWSYVIKQLVTRLDRVATTSCSSYHRRIVKGYLHEGPREYLSD